MQQFIWTFRRVPLGPYQTRIFDGRTYAHSTPQAWASIEECIASHVADQSFHTGDSVVVAMRKTKGRGAGQYSRTYRINADGRAEFVCGIFPKNKAKVG
jgi:hypothetical protein